MPTQNRGPRFVDADVHERAELIDLLPYLDSIWHRYITDYGWTPERLLPYSQPTAGGLDRADSKPDGVRPGGSDLGFMREQLLDEYDVAAAVLTGWLNVSSLQEGWPEFKTALMSAYNDWQAERWLERDERLFGSIHVNPWDVEGAVREIDRMAAHPKVAQVMLYSGSEPFGDAAVPPDLRCGGAARAAGRDPPQRELADRARPPPLLHRVAHAGLPGLHVAGGEHRLQRRPRPLRGPRR